MNQKSNRNLEKDVDKSRRTLLKTFLAGTALFALENALSPLNTFAQQRNSHQTLKAVRYMAVHPAGVGFTQSVASGDPTSSGAMLWTRVDPDITGIDAVSAEHPNQNITEWLGNGTVKNTDFIEKGQAVMVEISKSSDFSTTVLTGFTPVWKDFDHIVRLDVDGHLEPSTSYYYRFTTKNGFISQTGRFKTLPAEADNSPVKFAYITCQDYTNGYFNALDHLADEELDFVVHVGDYIYESVGDPLYQSPIEGRKIVLPGGGIKARTIEDYRTIYRVYRQDGDLQKLHEKHSMIGIWDDHEFANDTYFPAIAPDDSLSPDPERRLVANQVWYEYMPARVMFDKELPFDQSIKIYRSFKIGSMAELIMTDERLYRSPHPCGPATTDKYFSSGCSDISNPNRSMLGTEQREWFLSKLASSDAVWKIWGNEVQFAVLKLFGRHLNLDAWDGYDAERRRISQHLKTFNVKNVIALTGDFHTFDAALMKEDYINDPDSEAVGVELMVGSVTSSNLREALRNALNNVPTNSSPIPLPVLDELIRVLKGRLGTVTTLTAELLLKELQGIIKLENPWMKLFDSTTHGYAVLELSQTKAVWTTYTVDQIETKGARKSLHWQCEIPRDKAELRVLEAGKLLNLS
ncbi:alkaline phosphatase D family protein [Mesobacillus campisalis]|uniref:alkaline phosphatase D family protein n=1 Tax=Mesobacillus campisalis TaxID=1408103 RepID=UPI00069C01AC|nr:alkaline phosphatase D family protein [Mesobacillus campisalis]